jgi:predicted N-acetyltransferase YhbS
MVKVRKATLEDETKVFELIEELFRAGGSSADRIRDLQASHKQFREIIKDDRKGDVFVAEDNGDMLGLITLSYAEAIRCSGIYASIEEFVVIERARGKGVGGKLIEAAVAEATARGCDEMDVNRPSDLGYPVYLRHGLKDLGKNLMTKLPIEKP